MLFSKLGVAPRSRMFIQLFRDHHTSGSPGPLKILQYPMFDIEPVIPALHARQMEAENRDLGPQPLAALMERWQLTNHELVEDSPEQLNHKQIQRAKSGRRLSLKMMMKVARSLNIAIWNRLSKEHKETFVEYLHKDIFSYAKDYNAEKPDPNEEMIQALFPEKKS